MTGDPETPECVWSYGGPRILLPTAEVNRWTDEIGPEPTPDEGLYKLVCDVDGYAGLVSPWGTTFLVFGDVNDNIYWRPGADGGGDFIRWVGADCLEQLFSFASDVADRDDWEERIEWQACASDFTLMDALATPDTLHAGAVEAARCATSYEREFGQYAMRIRIEPGDYTLESCYAEREDAITIVQRLRRA